MNVPPTSSPPASAPPQNLPADFFKAFQDTARADSARAAADSTAIGRFSSDLNEASRLLLSGEWGQLWNKVYAGTINLLVDFLPRLLLALIVFLILYAFFQLLSQGLHHMLNRSKRVDVGLQNLLLKSYRVVTLFIIAVVVLAQLNVDVTALVAGLGIAGIALGFAARDSLENFISGITILVDRPFRIGDNIEIDGQFGSVEEITLRSTRVRTLNNQIMVMPNTLMITQKLINHTMLKTIRVEVPFGIAYKEHAEEARKVALATTEGDKRLHPDYAPKVVVTGLGASSVDLSMRLYLRNPKLEIPVRFEYIEKVREALRAADIEIPFPHLQLFIDEAKAFENAPLLRAAPDEADGTANP